MCMNLSDSYELHEIVYSSVELVDDFPELYKTILGIFLEKYSSQIEYGKHLLLALLRHGELIVDKSRVVLNMKHIIIYSVFLLLFCAVAMLVLPFVTCFVKQKSIDAIKYRYYLCAEAILLVFTAAVLLIGIVIYWQIGNHLTKTIFECPAMVQRLIQDIMDSVDHFSKQLNALRMVLTGRKDMLVKQIFALPRQLGKLVDSTLEPDLRYILENIRESLILLNATDQKDLDDLCEDDFETFISSSALILKNPLTRNVDISAQSESFDYLDHGRKLRDLLQQLYNIFDFVDNLCQRFENSAKTVLVKVEQDLKAYNFEFSLTKNLSKDLKNAYGVLRYINASAAKIEMFTKRLAFPRLGYTMGNGVYWIIMLPSLYSASFFILLSAGILSALLEWQSISTSKNYSGSKRTLVILKVSTYVSLILLWSIFLLATVSYLTFWPVSFACRIINDGTIFRDYLDANIWNNRTWLDNALRGTLEVNNTKLKCVMDMCNRNMTVFSILDLKMPQWDEFLKADIQIDRNALQARLTKELGRIDLMRFHDFKKIMDNIAVVSQHLNLEIAQMDRTNLGSLENATDLEQVKSTFGETVKLLQMHWILLEIQKKIYAAEVINDRILKKFNRLKMKSVSIFLMETAEDFQCQIDAMKKYVVHTLKNNLGNCYVAPYSFRTANWMICENILYIIMSLFISLSIIAFGMFVSLLLTYRLQKYMKGTFEHYKLSQFVDRRYSSKTSKILTRELLTAAKTPDTC